MRMTSRLTSILVAGLLCAAPVQAQSPQAEAVPLATTQPAGSSAAEPSLASRIGERAAKLGQNHPSDLAALQAHYGSAPDKPRWTSGGALTPRARAVMAEIAKADDWGLSASSFELPSDGESLGADTMIEAEARLTLAVLKYARHARGGRLTPTGLSDNLDRTLNLLDPAKVLEDIAGAPEPDAYLRGLHPRHPQFERLRRLLLDLRAGTYQPEQPPVVAEPTSEPPAKSRNGRKAAAKPKKPAPPPAITAERVLANMEQWRWMPDNLGRLHAWVNIPEFTLRVVKDSSVILSERVIVGTPINQTPIFSKEMQTVVFQPGWGVPQGIKVKELLPRLLAGSDPITSRGLVVRHRGREADPLSIDWRTVDIRRVSIVQPPGPSNALGMVKFLFPNKHDVYMHDTPSKNLFNAEVRAFSFGCVRVRNPMRLAEVVFAETGGWSASRVAGLARGRPENEVAVPGRLDVHLTYFTVTVDDQGKAHSFRDLYGHEPRIKAGLEGRNERIVAQRHEDLGQLRNQLISRARPVRVERRTVEAEERERPQRQRAKQVQRPRVAASAGGNRGGGGFFNVYGGF